MAIEWSGRTTAYAHKHNDWKDRSLEDVTPAFTKVRYLDVQWSTCPVEVEDQVRDLWRLFEYGNDHYICKTSINDLAELQGPVDKFVDGKWQQVPMKTDAIIQYVREADPDIKDEDLFLIHWWW